MERLLSCVLVVGLLCASHPSAGTSSATDELGVQRCDTDCQTVFTDCMLACDGEPSCQAACRAHVEQCVSECKARHPGAPAPPAKPN